MLLNAENNKLLTLSIKDINKICNIYSFTVYIEPFISGNSSVPSRLIEHKKGIGNKKFVKMLLNTRNE